jgi:magnesium transporter
MNVIVNDQTHWGWLALLLLAMLIMSLILLRWAHKQGWWG